RCALGVTLRQSLAQPRQFLLNRSKQSFPLPFKGGNSIGREQATSGKNAAEGIFQGSQAPGNDSEHHWRNQQAKRDAQTDFDIGRLRREPTEEWVACFHAG